MQPSPMQLPTADQLHDQLARLEGLKQTMRARSAGGDDRQGRYMKVDTARLAYTNNVAIPGLRLGKLVPDTDWAMLFGPYDTDLHGPARVEAHKWADKHKPDPRRHEVSAVDAARQRTLLEWAERNPSAFYKPVSAPRGAPHVYRFTWGPYAQYTVQDLVRDGCRKALTPRTSSPITMAGGPFLHWLAGRTFKWSFPMHLQLYVALLDVRGPVATTRGSQHEPLNLARAREMYRAYAEPQMRAPHRPPAANPGAATASTAADDDDQPFVETEAPFITANAISAAQQSYFASVVTHMALTPYERWDTLWATPPDPTCARVFDASGFELLPVLFWSPARMWAHRGVRTPCARHGWAHADHVTVYESWSQRLVKGMSSDYCVGLQRARCSACASEVAKLRDKVKSASQAGAPPAAIEALRREKKEGYSPDFSTVDARLIQHWSERASTVWVAQKFPFFLTHRAGITLDVLRLLVRGQRTGQGPHHFEAMLREFRCTTAVETQVQCYSFQHALAHHQTVNASSEPPFALQQLRSSVSQVSDTYLTHILEAWFGRIERYILLWFEQHCPMDICLADHHGKYSSRQRLEGERFLNWVYKCMNSWGGLPISVFVEGTSMFDPTTVRAHDGYLQAAKRHGHEPTWHAVVDNPHKDGRGLMSNLRPGNGLPRLTYPRDRIVIVATEAECDAAVAALRQQFDASEPVLYWDSENPMYTVESGTPKATLVQITASEAAVYLFRVGAWPSCFPSFSQLMEDSSVAKLAHFCECDVSRLQARFPPLSVANAQNLLDAMQLQEPPAKRGLSDLVQAHLGKWLDKRIDHKLWGLPQLLESHVVYAAVDAYAVMLLHKHATADSGAGVGGMSGAGVGSGGAGGSSSSNAAGGSAAGGNGGDSDDGSQQQSPRVAVSRHRRSTRLASVLAGGASGDGGADGGDDEEDEEAAPVQDTPSGEEAGAEGDGGAFDLQPRLVEEAKRQVDQYVTGNSQADLVLSAALNADSRKRLHRHCDAYDINHASVGPASDRRLVVSRWRPLQPITAALANEVVGALVARDGGNGDGSQPPVRGRVERYDGGSVKWILVYVDGSTECVDLDTLNLRLQRRARADARAGAQMPPPPPVGTDATSEQELQTLLQGVRDDWATRLPRYDHRHWMGNWGHMVAAQKNGPAYNLFFILTSDAMFHRLSGEYDDVVAHCKLLGMSDAQIERLRRSYWRRKCRVTCPEPAVLIRSLYDVYLFFKDMRDPLRPSHAFFTDNAHAIMLKEMVYVQEGGLSDPPNMNMYRVVGRHRRTRRVIFRSLRNNSPLEASFMHYRASVHPTQKGAGPTSTHMRSILWDFVWTLKAAIKAGRMRDIGMYEPWLVDMLADVCRDWLSEDELPALLRGWTRTDTSTEPCTVRGVDFEYLRQRKAAGDAGACFSTLGTDADAAKVLKYPQLVLDGDWAQLFELTGVFTDAKRLEELATRVTERALTSAALNAHGVQALIDRLRRTDGGTAAAALLRFGAELPTDLGVAGPLPPLGGVGTGAGTSATISHEPVPPAPQPEQEDAAGDDEDNLPPGGGLDDDGSDLGEEDNGCEEDDDAEDSQPPSADTPVASPMRPVQQPAQQPGSVGGAFRQRFSAAAAAAASFFGGSSSPSGTAPAAAPAASASASAAAGVGAGAAQRGGPAQRGRARGAAGGSARGGRGSVRGGSGSARGGGGSARGGGGSGSSTKKRGVRPSKEAERERKRLRREEDGKKREEAGGKAFKKRRRMGDPVP